MHRHGVTCGKLLGEGGPCERVVNEAVGKEQAALVNSAFAGRPVSLPNGYAGCNSAGCHRPCMRAGMRVHWMQKCLGGSRAAPSMFQRMHKAGLCGSCRSSGCSMLSSNPSILNASSS